MATGDSRDVLSRVRHLIPKRWFAWGAPYRDAVMGGIADGAAWCYGLISYARLQSRIATCTGIFLDVVAWDFFGGRFTRRFGETDNSFQPRILQEILRPRQTRAAIILLLQQLTGRTPKLIELWNTGDMGGYGSGMCGYGVGAGGYGSLLYNNTMFINAFRTPNQGVPNVNGYGGYLGGYGVGSIEYITTSQVVGLITDAEIYARVQQTIAAGTTAWVDISN